MDRVSSMLSFVKVVETGGFSTAARQLDLSTSAVTTHVKWLEDRLGVRLLNRTTRNVSLTEAGRSYYERCVQILSEIEDAEGAVQELQAKPRGVLRLNIHPALSQLVAPLITKFTALHSEVSVRVSMTSRLIDLVEQGVDLAIRRSTPADSSLIVRRIGSFRLVACASPDYIAKHGRPEHPSDLAHHNCLLFYDSPLGKNLPFKGPDGDFLVPVSGNLETNSNNLLREAALLGHGVYYAPAFTVADDFESGALVPLLTEFQADPYSIDAVYPHRQHLPAKVRSFIDLAVSNFCAAKWHAAGEPIHKAAAE